MSRASSLLLQTIVAVALLSDPGGAFAQSNGATRVDRAVAVVGERVLTATEVEVAMAMAERDESPVPVLNPEDRRPVDWWVEQAMLRELAGDIGVYQPTSVQVRDRVERLLAMFDPTELSELDRRLGLDRDGIEAWVYARLVVERYVHRNIGLAVEAARGDETTYRERYTDWIAELQGTVAVRRIAPIQAR